MALRTRVRGKDIKRALKAMARSAEEGLTLGTAPSFHAQTGVFDDCKVSIQVGEQALLIPAATARAIAAACRERGRRQLDNVADGIDEMAGIAEAMIRDRPDMAAARREYLGPSSHVH